MKTIEILTFLKKKIKIFLQNFDQYQDFQPFWKNIDIFWNFDKNGGFPKIFTKMNILKIWTKIQIFRKFGLNIIFLKILYHIQDFRKKTRHFWIFRSNSGFLKRFPPKLRFSFLKISTQIEIFRKFWPKSRFFENFDQNRDFSKNSTIIQIFRKFRPKQRFLENSGQHRDF